MDNESVNIENYPDMILKLKKVSSNEIIYHELTHIIDEHNFFFTAGRSVMELHKLINKLQNPNDKKEYIQRTLRVLWDAYINGRLSKHGIFVDSMNNCLELLTGRNHEGKKDLNIKTEKYLNKVWKSSRLSIDILISIAKKIPYHRYDLL
ncbi:MAG TPA: hypothetical protein G4N92_05010 [Anaerolineae bacterium]|nr:hypothetical protein [Anaerolineae bacterium]